MATGQFTIDLTDQVLAGPRQQRPAALRSRWLRVLIGVMAALTFSGGVTTAAVGVSASSDEPVTASTLTTLQASGAAARRAGTLHFTLTSKGRVQGRDFTIGFTGGIDNKRRAGAFDVNFAGVELREIFDRDRLYVRLPAASRAFSQGKPWISVPLSSVLSAKGQKQLTAGDPTVDLDALALLTDVHRLGTERIDGVNTTHYSGTYNFGRGLDGLAPALRKRIEAGVVKSSAGGTEVWIGSDGLPRRQRTVAELTVSGATTKLVTTVNYSGFGKPVTIDIPRAQDVFMATTLPGLTG